MRRIRFWLNTLLLLAPLVALGVGGYHSLGRALGYLTSGGRLAAVVSTEATRILHRRVVVRSIRFRSSAWSLLPNQVQVTGVSIQQSQADTAPLLAAAATVSVSYSIQALLSGSLSVPIVDQVSVVRPVVHLRRSASGHWNFEGLIKPGKKPGRPFATRIVFSDGSLFYLDRDFPHPAGVPRSALNTRLFGLTGILLIRPGQSYSFNAYGRADGKYLSDFRATGIAGASPARAEVRLIADGLNLAPLSRRFLSPARGQVSRGLADADLTVVWAPGEAVLERGQMIPGLSAVGQIALHNADATIAGVLAPVSDANGLLEIAPDAVAASASCNFAGAGLRLQGRLVGLSRLALASGAQRSWPFITGNVALMHGDFGALSRAIGLTRMLRNRLTPGDLYTIAHASMKGNVTAQLAGPLNNFAATVQGRLSLVRYSRFEGRNLLVRGYYADRALDIGTRGVFAGGQAAVRGHISFLPEGRFEAEGHGRNLNIALLPRYFSTPLHGTAQVDVSIRGRNGRTPYITARGNAVNIRVGKQTISSLYLSAASLGRHLVLKSLDLQDDKGFIQANGQIGLTSQKLNLQVEGDELDLGAIAQSLRKSATPSSLPLFNEPTAATGQQGLVSLARLQGVGYFRGQVGGTFHSPDVKGIVNAFALSAGRLSIDRVSATVDASPSRVLISSGLAERYPGQLQFSGSLTGIKTGKPAVDLTAQAQDFDVPDLLQLAGFPQTTATGATAPVVVTGRLNTGPVRITGPLSSPALNAPVDVTWTDGSVNGLPVTNAHVQASYSKSGIRIDALRADAAGGSLTGSGTLSNGKTLDLAVSASHINLGAVESALPGATPGPLTGVLSLRAAISGTLQRPTVQGDLSISDLTYGALPIGSVSGAVGYQSRMVTLSNVQIAGPPGTAGEPDVISAPVLTYVPSTGSVTGSIDWNGVPLSRLAEALRSPVNGASTGAPLSSALAGPLVGAVSGQARVSGTLTHPVADAQVTGANLTVDNEHVTRLSASARISPAEILSPSPAFPGDGIQLVSPDGVFRLLDATYVPGGAVHGTLTATGINLAAARKLMLASRIGSVSGTANVTAVISGIASSPVITADATVDNLDVAGQTIDRIQASHIVIAEPAIEASSITITRAYGAAGGVHGVFTGSAHGSIGFHWKPPFISPDAPIDVTVAVPNEPLQSLSALAPGVSLDAVGSFSGSVTVGHTLSDPEASGSIRLAASRIRFGRARTGLTNVSLGLDFNQTRVSVAPGSSATTYDFNPGAPAGRRAGTPIVLGGSLPLTGRGAPGQGGITFREDTLYIDESPLPVIGSGSISSEASFDLAVTGSAMRPELDGQVTLYNGSVAPPLAFNAPTGGAIALPVNPVFNLTLLVKNSVQVRNVAFSARINGQVALKGPLLQPASGIAGVREFSIGTPMLAGRELGIRVQGRLNVEQGYFQVPTVPRFTILPPGLVTLTYPTFDASNGGEPSLGVTVDIRAQNYMDLPSASSLSGQRRYRVTIVARGSVTGYGSSPITGQSGLSLDILTDPPDFVGNQQELQQRLASAMGGSALSGLTRNPGQVLVSTLSDVVTSTVLPSLFQKPAAALGFEQLSLNYDPIEHLSFIASRHLFGPFYVSYSQSLGEQRLLYDLKFSVRFRDRYQVSYEEDNLNGVPDQRVLLEGVWSF